MTSMFLCALLLNRVELIWHLVVFLSPSSVTKMHHCCEALTLLCFTWASQPAVCDQPLFAEVRNRFLFPNTLINWFSRYYTGKRSLQNRHVDCSDSSRLVLFYLIKTQLSWRNILLVKIAVYCHETKLWCSTLEKTVMKRWPSKDTFSQVLWDVLGNKEWWASATHRNKMIL